jgi:predicted RNase H-like nuclease (RuvC/YqgF family)
MAKTLLFLQELGVKSYDDLIEKCDTISKSFNQRSTRIKQIETRQKEITELQKAFSTYGKTRETYKRYLASKRDPSFYEKHRADITLHEAAKRHFDNLGYGKSKPLPKMDTLKQEWATLESEKKKLYSGYKSERERMISLKMAKQNVDMFLGEPRSRQVSKSHERDAL